MFAVSNVVDLTKPLRVALRNEILINGNDNDNDNIDILCVKSNLGKCRMWHRVLCQFIFVMYNDVDLRNVFCKAFESLVLRCRSGLNAK